MLFVLGGQYQKRILQFDKNIVILLCATGIHQLWCTGIHQLW